MNQFPSFPTVAASTVDSRARERSFIQTAYGWMFGGLLLTAAAAVWVALSPSMQQLIFGTPLKWVLIVGELGLVMYLSFRVNKMSPAAAASMFFVYAVLNGLTLGIIFLIYSIGSIALAFGVASGMFGAMSVYGLVTKRDLTSWGSFFMMGVFGLILASVVNIFLKSSALDFAVSVIGVFVFVGLTAYDTQKLKTLAHAAGPDPTNFAVIGALALYLDFINLFLMLLRLFGRRN